MRSLQPQHAKTTRLGEVTVEGSRFCYDLDKESFVDFTRQQKMQAVHKRLMEHLQEAPRCSFLLPALLDFLAQARNDQLLPRNYRFSHFEAWLIHEASLTCEEQQQIRSKIAGKHLPLAAYQSCFPVGLGKVLEGSHIVTAHDSPDLDTTVASFWSWLDAFGLQLATGLHHWNLPGREPPFYARPLFDEFFPKTLFELLPKGRKRLSLTARDLLTHQNVQKVTGRTPTTHLDHGHHNRAILLVDEQGHFLTDWHTEDVENVHNLLAIVQSFFLWFEKHLHTRLISLFAEEHVTAESIQACVNDVFQVLLRESEPFEDLMGSESALFDALLRSVMSVEQGLDASFWDWFSTIEQWILPGFLKFKVQMDALEDSSLYDEQGVLRENRPLLFSYLHRLFIALDTEIQSCLEHFNFLDFGARIKEAVFGTQTVFVSPEADVEEVRKKIGESHFLTVVEPTEEGKLVPLGVIYASTLRQTALGTVSLRDFSNSEEVTLEPYLSIVSIVDHHKSRFQTKAVPAIMIADVQSTNTLLAEQSLAQEGEDPWFVHPNRLYAESMMMLQAILDDTDLLMKVTPRDLDCIVALLNRLKRLACGEGCEALSFVDLSRDASFVIQARQRLLKHPELYSIYKKLFEHKAAVQKEQILRCCAEEDIDLFGDTKLLQGCSRVGQTKLFMRNLELHSTHQDALIAQWIRQSQEFHHLNSAVDLHLYMVCTVVGAEEVFAEEVREWKHEDALWGWIPGTERSVEHLTRFLRGFVNLPAWEEGLPQVQLIGKQASVWQNLWEQLFPGKVEIKEGKNIPYFMIHYPAGTVNSRKASIAPHLPIYAS